MGLGVCRYRQTVQERLLMGAQRAVHREDTERAHRQKDQSVEIKSDATECRRAAGAPGRANISPPHVRKNQCIPEDGLAKVEREASGDRG